MLNKLFWLQCHKEKRLDILVMWTSDVTGCNILSTFLTASVIINNLTYVECM